MKKRYLRNFDFQFRSTNTGIREYRMRAIPMQLRKIFLIISGIPKYYLLEAIKKKENIYYFNTPLDNLQTFKLNLSVHGTSMDPVPSQTVIENSYSNNIHHERHLVSGHP